MKHLNGLIHSLNQTLNCNKSRMTCFAQMLLALVAVQTINLQKIALAASSKAQPSSRYRRLQRFFATFHIDFVVVARWVFQLFFAKSDRYYLIMDRTNTRR